jgi:hypothetical protein
VKRLLLQVLPILLAADLAVAEQGRALYSFEEVSAFFLAKNPDKTEEYFDAMVAKESFATLAKYDCFGTYWEYRLASAAGHSVRFNHALCRDLYVNPFAYHRWFESYKQAVTESNTASDGTSSSSPKWMTSFGGRPHTKDPKHLVWTFFSANTGQPKDLFNVCVRTDECFLPFWESARARSKGQASSFDLAQCREVNPRYLDSDANSKGFYPTNVAPARNLAGRQTGGQCNSTYATYAANSISPTKPPSGRPDHPPSVRFFIAETGKTAEDYRKLPSWAKDQWAVWHSQGSTASAPVYTRQTYNESKSKEKGGSALERFLWGNIAREIDCKIGECAERERLLRDVEAAAARGAARGSRANSRRYYNSKGRPVPQNNSPQPLRTGPYCSGPYAGDCD